MQKLILVISIVLTATLFAQNKETVLAEKFNVKEIYLDEEEAIIGSIRDYFSDSQNNIYLIEKNALHKFSPEGKFIKTKYSKGSGPGEFGRLHSIIINNKNVIFLEDGLMSRILKYNTELEYTSEFKKQYPGTIDSWCFFQDTLLFAQHCFEPKIPISIYNANTSKFIKYVGPGTDFVEKYGLNDLGGGITVCGNNVFYISAAEYDLRKIKADWKTELIIDQKPSHFKTVNNKINKVNPFDFPYSEIINLYCIDNQLYVLSAPPFENEKFPERLICDIISPEGKIIHENLRGNILTQTKQISNGKFIKVLDQREKFPEEDKRSKILVRIIELKNKGEKK